ncbi:AfsR/SARP family transcriptional regulator, partial [Nakamurella sp. GG22]
MLGSLVVRRADGTEVHRGEWRTGKVIDLLRLLALADGEPVASKSLVASLWPGSDQQHGNASLRTAASQIRRIVGGDHVERSLSGLRLRHAWIDVTEFRRLATQAHQLAALGHHNAVRIAAREASELYRGDFGAHDDGAEWVQSERNSLSGAHQVLLCDAAEAAIELGLGHEGVDFARRATTVDPFSERATRLLMRGHAAVGEVCLALREYERCRLLLVDELGIDPSPPTRELHLALLRGEHSGAPPIQEPLGAEPPAARPRLTPRRLTSPPLIPAPPTPPP